MVDLMGNEQPTCV